MVSSLSAPIGTKPLTSLSLLRTPSLSLSLLASDSLSVEHYDLSSTSFTNNRQLENNKNVSNAGSKFWTHLQLRPAAAQQTN